MIRLFTLLFSLFITLSITAQPFSIGTRTITFNDPARTGGFGSGGGAGRQIQTEIYYPATSAGTNTPVANGKFPVVVFGHGFVMTWDVYQPFYDSLARLGYICALPRTEGSLSPVHTDFAKDLALVLDKLIAADTVSTSPFFGKVNGKGAIAGHSMGGGSTLLADQYTTNAVCYLTMAPAITNPSSALAARTITKPVCIISGTKDCVAGYAGHQKPQYDSLKVSTCKQLVSITDARHCSFSNGGSTTCNLGEGTSGCAAVGSINTPQQLAITRNIMLPYFNYFLKGICSEWSVYQNYITSTAGITTEQVCTMNVPSNATVSGDSIFCTGSSASLSAQPSGFTYKWTDNQNGQSITVNQSGNYGVNIANAYCSINSILFVVSEKSAPTAPSLQQNPTTFCDNAGNVVLTVPTVPTAQKYIWSVPQGWSTSSNDSSTTLIVTPGTNGKFFVSGWNSDCGLGPADSLDVSIISTPTFTGSINGSASICSNAPLQQVFGLNGGFTNADSLRWSANNWQLLSGQGSTSATFQQNGLSDSVKVYGINNCGSSIVQVFQVIVNDTSALQLSRTGDTLTASSGFSSYAWYRNDSLIQGVTGNSYVATVSGNYYVEGVNASSCISTSNSLGVTIVINSIEDAGANTFLIYPNPATDKMILEIDEATLPSDLSIIDIHGREVVRTSLTSKVNEINLSLLSRGTYNVVIKNAKRVIAKLVVLQ